MACSIPASWGLTVMLDEFARDLARCASCHDQCLFATGEVFASGRHTVATSRKALVLQALRAGTLSWTPSVISLMYLGLSSGVQHAVCVHRGDPEGWPDETVYLRAARAEIVRRGLAPGWATRLRDVCRASGNPYGLPDGPVPNRSGAVLFLDGASRAFQPDASRWWAEVAVYLREPLGTLASGSTGFELFDLGFVDDARDAARRLYDRLRGLEPAIVLSDSPEAVYMMRVVWPEWELGPPFPVTHTSEWLAALLEAQRIELPLKGKPVAFQDPSCLARYLGVVQAPRQVLRRLGVHLVEMLRYGEEAPPVGPYFGEGVGSWVIRLVRERASSATAAGAEAIVTASPFDFRNLQNAFPAVDLGALAAERLLHA